MVKVFSIIFSCLFLLSNVINAKEIREWESEKVLSINREIPHASFIPFSKKEMSFNNNNDIHFILTSTEMKNKWLQSMFENNNNLYFVYIDTVVT